MRLLLILLCFITGVLVNLFSKKEKVYTAYRKSYSYAALYVDTSMYPIDTTHYGYDPPCKGVILLVFNGYLSKNTYYGLNDFAPSLLSDSTRTFIQEEVARYYDLWDVVITQDDSLFYTFPQNHRIRVVISQSLGVIYLNYTLYHPGGVSKYNSLYLRDSIPSFVSLPIIGTNPSYLAIVIAHESAHQIGLLHQALVIHGTIIEDYSPGNEDSIPIMGGYGEKQKRYWTKGINDVGQEQDDTLIISKTFRRIK